MLRDICTSKFKMEIVNDMGDVVVFECDSKDALLDISEEYLEDNDIMCIELIEYNDEGTHRVDCEFIKEPQWV